MAASDLMAGYRVAGGGRANIIDLTKAASDVAKHQLEQDELTRTRQEAFDKNRADFKKKMQETYDQYVYEDQYDDTGILELDKAAEKLRGSVKAQYLQTEYEYNNGMIDEATVRARNNNLKGQVGQFQSLTKDITEWGARRDALEAEGKSNALNDTRAEVLEKYAKSFKIKSTGEGLIMSTVGTDGKEIDVPAGQFKRLMETDVAVDIETDLDDLVKLGGLDERIEGWGKDAKKITEYTKGKEGQSLIKTRVDQWTPAESIDYALKRGLISDNEEEAKEKGIPYMGPDAVFATEVQDGVKEKIYESMSQELEDRLTFKAKSELYDDKFAMEAVKESNRQKGRAEKSIIKTAELAVTDEISGDKSNVTEVYPTSGKGIEMSYIVQDPGSNMSRAFMDSIEGVAGHAIPANAIKSTKFKKERYNKRTGLIEVTLGYDYENQPEKISEEVLSLTDNKYTEYIDKVVEQHNNKVKANPEGGGQIIDQATKKDMYSNRQQGVNFATQAMPKSGSGTFKYVPRTLSEYNTILTATGREPISSDKWSEFMLVKRQNKVANQSMARFNPTGTKVAQTTAATPTSETQTAVNTLSGKSATDQQ